jgi:hypothetical protein
MAIAHVCLGCGYDLARVRPQREPHYRLPLIACPRCGTHCVRVDHPILVRWRNAKRVLLSLAVLLAQAAMATGLAMLTPTVVVVTLRALANLPIEWERRAIALTLIGASITGLGLLTGAWTRAAFAHLNQWWVWLSWLALMGLAGLVAIIVNPMDLYENRVGYLLANADVALAYVKTYVIVASMVLLIIMLVAWLATPLGVLVLKRIDRGRAAAWRNALKRRRRAKVAA